MGWVEAVHGNRSGDAANVMQALGGIRHAALAALVTWAVGFSGHAVAGAQEHLIKGVHATDYRMARRVGAQFVRLWDFDLRWLRSEIVEPAPNQWRDQTHNFRRLKAAGLEPLAVLFNTNPWRTSGHLLPDLTWKNEPSLSWEDLSPWMQYVDVMTTRYKDYCRFWEIWNEPGGEPWLKHRGNPGFFAGTAEQYVELVRQAAVIIRKNNAGIVVGGGGLLLRQQFAWDSINAGLARHCDIISIHYGYNGEPDLGKQLVYKTWIDSLRATVGDKPIWNTEVSIFDENPETIQRLLRVNKEAGVSAVFYYYLARRSDGHPENMADAAGLKPWALAFREHP